MACGGGPGGNGIPGRGICNCIAAAKPGGSGGGGPGGGGPGGGGNSDCGGPGGPVRWRFHVAGSAWAGAWKGGGCAYGCGGYDRGG